MEICRTRQAVRALILDEHESVLLVHFDWPGCPIPGGFWACPGGGREESESAEEALRRELAEELGFRDFTVEGALWHLTRFFPMEDWDGQKDTWYLIRTTYFTPTPEASLSSENVHDIRWFTREEIRAGIAAFSPRDLAEQIAVTLAEGVPTTVREIPALP